MDDRYSWFEEHISLALKPAAEELKRFTSVDEHRNAIIDFLNDDAHKILFVYFNAQQNKLSCALRAPEQIAGKSIVFMKHAPKGMRIVRSNMSEVISYLECAENLLSHFDLLIREVYLPIIATSPNLQHQISASVSAADRSDAIATRFTEPTDKPKGEMTRTKSNSNNEKMLELLHRLVATIDVAYGQQQGAILLPVPNLEFLQSLLRPSGQEPAATNSVGNLKPAAVVHILESVVLNWIKQIRTHVLRFDAVDFERKRFGANELAPLAEIACWKSFLKQLNFLRYQLDSAEVRQIRQTLANYQSQFHVQLQTIVTQFERVHEQASENLRFLQVLYPYLDRLHEARTVGQLYELIYPIMHVLFLIWQNSVYYHQAEKFRHLLSLITEQLIGKIISSTRIDARRITDEPEFAYQELKAALRCAATFRGAYIDYRQKASDLNKKNKQEIEDKLMHLPRGSLWTTKLYGPLSYKPKYGGREEANEQDGESFDIDPLLFESEWPKQTSKCFEKLNRFIERCNDVLELLECTKQFNSLELPARHGATGHDELNALVLAVYEEYQLVITDLVAELATMTELRENILAIPTQARAASPSFELTFYRFRERIKELETRLAFHLRSAYYTVHQTGMQANILSFLRLTEVFRGVCARELICTHLRDIFDQLLTRSMHEVEECHAHYRDTKQVPSLQPVYPNARTALVQQLTYIRELRARIEVPMEKIRQVLPPVVVQSEMGWQLRYKFDDLNKQLIRDEQELMAQWLSSYRSCQAELLEFLKLPILRAVEQANSSSSGVPNASLFADPFLAELAEKHETVRTLLTKLEQLYGQSESGKILRVVVNFEPRLLQYLEDYYGLTHTFANSVDVPALVADSLSKINYDQIRFALKQLDMVVRKYNLLMQSLQPIESVLFYNELHSVEHLIKRGTNDVVWLFDDQILDFIEQAHTKLDAFMQRRFFPVQANHSELLQLVQAWLPLNFLHVHCTDQAESGFELDPMLGGDAKLDASMEGACTTSKQIDWYLHNMYDFAHLLLQQRTGALTISDLMAALRRIADNYEEKLNYANRRIQTLIAESFAALEVNESAPQWIVYREYCDTLIRSYLKRNCLQNLDTLICRMKPGANAQFSAPTLSILLLLNNLRLEFVPAIDSEAQTSAHSSATSNADSGAHKTSGEEKQYLNLEDFLKRAWLDKLLFDRANLIRRVSKSTNAGLSSQTTLEDNQLRSYKEELYDDSDIQERLNYVDKLVRESIVQCTTYSREFEQFNFLWLLNQAEVFDAFLEGHYTPIKKRPQHSALAKQSVLKTQRGESVMSGSVSESASRSTSRHSSAMRGTGSKSPSSSPSRTTSRRHAYTLDTRERSQDSVMLTERRFLTSRVNTVKPSGAEDQAVTPGLSEFETEMQIYKTTMQELGARPTHIDLDWLSVDLRVLKEHLGTLCMKWMLIYCKYLAERVNTQLQDFDTFLRRVEPELEHLTGEEQDFGSSRKALRLLYELSVRQQDQDFELKFDILMRTVSLLEKFEHGGLLTASTRALYDNVPSRWAQLKTKITLIKQRLTPKLQSQLDTIRKDLAAFNERIVALNNELMRSELFQFSCDDSLFNILLDNFSKRTGVLESESQDLQQVQLLLHLSVVNFSFLAELREKLQIVQRIHELKVAILSTHAGWLKERWTNLNSEALRNACDNHMQMLTTDIFPPEILAEEQMAKRQRYLSEIRSWEIFHNLDARIMDIRQCLTLLAALSNTPLRTRHFKQLIRLSAAIHEEDARAELERERTRTDKVEKANDDDSAVTKEKRENKSKVNFEYLESASIEYLSKMTFGQILELRLQTRLNGELNTIFRQAQDEQAIERSLKSLEEIWLSKQFEFTPYRYVVYDEFSLRQREDFHELLVTTQRNPAVPTSNRNLAQQPSPAPTQTDPNANANANATTTTDANANNEETKKSRASVREKSARSRSRQQSAKSARGTAYSQSRAISMISLPLSILNMELTEADEMPSAPDADQDAERRLRTINLFSNYEDIKQQLVAHQYVLQSLMSNQLALNTFADSINKWQSELRAIEHLLERWNAAQECWLLVEKVFHYYAFAKPKMVRVREEKMTKFALVDKELAMLMGASQKTGSIMQCCSRKNIEDLVAQILQVLNECLSYLVRRDNDHGLFDYLRSRFPRFALLENMDVLTLCSKNACSLLQLSSKRLLAKVFPSLSELVTATSSSGSTTPAAQLQCVIRGVYSHARADLLLFDQPINLPEWDCNVEDILAVLECRVKRTLLKQLAVRLAPTPAPSDEQSPSEQKATTEPAPTKDEPAWIAVFDHIFKLFSHFEEFAVDTLFLEELVRFSNAVGQDLAAWRKTAETTCVAHIENVRKLYDFVDHLKAGRVDTDVVVQHRINLDEQMRAVVDKINETRLALENIHLKKSANASPVKEHDAPPPAAEQDEENQTRNDTANDAPPADAAANSPARSQISVRSQQSRAALTQTVQFTLATDEERLFKQEQELKQKLAVLENQLAKFRTDVIAVYNRLLSSLRAMLDKSKLLLASTYLFMQIAQSPEKDNMFIYKWTPPEQKQNADDEPAAAETDDVKLGSLSVKYANAEFEYGFEYQGLTRFNAHLLSTLATSSRCASILIGATPQADAAASESESAPTAKKPVLLLCSSAILYAINTLVGRAVFSFDCSTFATAAQLKSLVRQSVTKAADDQNDSGQSADADGSNSKKSNSVLIFNSVELLDASVLDDVVQTSSEQEGQQVAQTYFRATVNGPVQDREQLGLHRFDVRQEEEEEELSHSLISALLLGAGFTKSIDEQSRALNKAIRYIRTLLQGERDAVSSGNLLAYALEVGEALLAAAYWPSCVNTNDDVHQQQCEHGAKCVDSETGVLLKALARTVTIVLHGVHATDECRNTMQHVLVSTLVAQFYPAYADHVEQLLKAEEIYQDASIMASFLLTPHPETTKTHETTFSSIPQRSGYEESSFTSRPQTGVADEPEGADEGLATDYGCANLGALVESVIHWQSPLIERLLGKNGTLWTKLKLLLEVVLFHAHRHKLLILHGQSGSGKSRLLTCLKAVMEESMHAPVQLVKVYPSRFSCEDMFGTNGVVESLVQNNEVLDSDRLYNSKHANTHVHAHVHGHMGVSKLVVFDGVLSEQQMSLFERFVASRTSTFTHVQHTDERLLAGTFSGLRNDLPSSFRLFWETDSLCGVSPALLAHACVLHVGDEDVQDAPKLERRSKLWEVIFQYTDVIEATFHKLETYLKLYHCADGDTDQYRFVLVDALCMMRRRELRGQFWKMLEGLLRNVNFADLAGQQSAKKRNILEEVLTCCALFTAFWTVGTFLQGGTQAAAGERFHEFFLHELLQPLAPEVKQIAKLLGVMKANNETFFDYQFSTDKLRFVRWNDVLTSLESGVFYHTKTIEPRSFWCVTLLSMHLTAPLDPDAPPYRPNTNIFAYLLVGPHGCGKTQFVLDAVQNIAINARANSGGASPTASAVVDKPQQDDELDHSSQPQSLTQSLAHMQGQTSGKKKRVSISAKAHRDARSHLAELVAELQSGYLQCSRLTDAPYFTKYLDQFLEWKFANQYRIRSGKHLLVFLDDLHAATADCSQQCMLAVLREQLDNEAYVHIEERGEGNQGRHVAQRRLLFDLQRMAYLITHAYSVTARASDQTAESELRRLTRKFVKFGYATPDEKELVTIYGRKLRVNLEAANNRFFEADSKKGLAPGSSHADDHADFLMPRSELLQRLVQNTVHLQKRIVQTYDTYYATSIQSRAQHDGEKVETDSERADSTKNTSLGLTGVSKACLFFNQKSLQLVFNRVATLFAEYASGIPGTSPSVENRIPDATYIQAWSHELAQTFKPRLAALMSCDTVLNSLVLQANGNVLEDQADALYRSEFVATLKQHFNMYPQVVRMHLPPENNLDDNSEESERFDEQIWTNLAYGMPLIGSAPPAARKTSALAESESSSSMVKAGGVNLSSLYVRCRNVDALRQCFNTIVHEYTRSIETNLHVNLYHCTLQRLCYLVRALTVPQISTTPGATLNAARNEPVHIWLPVLNGGSFSETYNLAKLCAHLTSYKLLELNVVFAQSTSISSTPQVGVSAHHNAHRQRPKSHSQVACEQLKCTLLRIFLKAVQDNLTYLLVVTSDDLLSIAAESCAASTRGEQQAIYEDLLVLLSQFFNLSHSAWRKTAELADGTESEALPSSTDDSALFLFNLLNDNEEMLATNVIRARSFNEQDDVRQKASRGDAVVVGDDNAGEKQGTSAKHGGKLSSKLSHDSMSRVRWWTQFLQIARRSVRLCFIETLYATPNLSASIAHSSFFSNTVYLVTSHWSVAELVRNAQYHLRSLSLLTDGERQNFAHALAAVHTTVRSFFNNNSAPIGLSAWQIAKLDESAENDVQQVLRALLSRFEAQRQGSILQQANAFANDQAELLCSNARYENFLQHFVRFLNIRHGQLIEQHAVNRRLLVQLNKIRQIFEKLHTTELKQETTINEEHRQSAFRLLKQLGEDLAINELQLASIQELNDRAAYLRKVLPQYELAYERMLYKSLAILTDAKKNVHQINMEELQDLRSMLKSPNDDIQDLLATIVVLLRRNVQADQLWHKGIKRQLANVDRFLEEMKTFDEADLPEAILVEVESRIQSRSVFATTMDQFQAEVNERFLGKQSVFQLIRWVTSIARYYRMLYAKLRPLQNRIETIQQNIADLDRRIQTFNTKYKGLDDRLHELESQFEEATEEKLEQFLKLQQLEQIVASLDKFQLKIQTEYSEMNSTDVAVNDVIANEHSAVAILSCFVAYLTTSPLDFQLTCLKKYVPDCLRARGLPFDMPRLNRPFAKFVLRLAATLISDGTLLEWVLPMIETHMEESDSHLAADFPSLRKLLHDVTIFLLMGNGTVALLPNDSELDRPSFEKRCLSLLERVANNSHLPCKLTVSKLPFSEFDKSEFEMTNEQMVHFAVTDCPRYASANLRNVLNFTYTLTGDLISPSDVLLLKKGSKRLQLNSRKFEPTGGLVPFGLSCLLQDGSVSRELLSYATPLPVSSMSITQFSFSDHLNVRLRHAIATQSHEQLYIKYAPALRATIDATAHLHTLLRFRIDSIITTRSLYTSDKVLEELDALVGRYHTLVNQTEKIRKRMALVEQLDRQKFDLTSRIIKELYRVLANFSVVDPLYRAQFMPVEKFEALVLHALAENFTSRDASDQQQPTSADAGDATEQRRDQRSAKKEALEEQNAGQMQQAAESDEDNSKFIQEVLAARQTHSRYRLIQQILGTISTPSAKTSRVRTATQHECEVPQLTNVDEVTLLRTVDTLIEQNGLLTGPEDEQTQSANTSEKQNAEADADANANADQEQKQGDTGDKKTQVDSQADENAQFAEMLLEKVAAQFWALAFNEVDALLLKFLVILIKLVHIRPQWNVTNHTEVDVLLNFEQIRTSLIHNGRKLKLHGTSRSRSKLLKGEDAQKTALEGAYERNVETSALIEHLAGRSTAWSAFRDWSTSKGQAELAEWLKSESPETNMVYSQLEHEPAEQKDKRAQFFQLMLVRLLAPDRFLTALQRFVAAFDVQSKDDGSQDQQPLDKVVQWLTAPKTPSYGAWILLHSEDIARLNDIRSSVEKSVTQLASGCNAEFKQLRNLQLAATSIQSETPTCFLLDAVDYQCETTVINVLRSLIEVRNHDSRTKICVLASVDTSRKLNSIDSALLNPFMLVSASRPSTQCDHTQLFTKLGVLNLSPVKSNARSMVAEVLRMSNNLLPLAHSLLLNDGLLCHQLPIVRMRAVALYCAQALPKKLLPDFGIQLHQTDPAVSLTAYFLLQLEEERKAFNHYVQQVHKQLTNLCQFLTEVDLETVLRISQKVHDRLQVAALLITEQVPVHFLYQIWQANSSHPIGPAINVANWLADVTTKYEHFKVVIASVAEWLASNTAALGTTNLATQIRDSISLFARSQLNIAHCQRLPQFFNLFKIVHARHSNVDIDCIDFDCQILSQTADSLTEPTREGRRRSLLPVCSTFNSDLSYTMRNMCAANTALRDGKVEHRSGSSTFVDVLLKPLVLGKEQASASQERLKLFCSETGSIVCQRLAENQVSFEFRLTDSTSIRDETFRKRPLYYYLQQGIAVQENVDDLLTSEADAGNLKELETTFPEAVLNKSEPSSQETEANEKADNEGEEEA